MGNKDSRGFGFGDRRQADRDEKAGTDARGVPSEFRTGTGAYGGHGYGGLGHNVDALNGEDFLRHIQDALRRDPRVPEDRIHVIVDAGRVTLSGYVGSESARAAAAESVGVLPGVRDVINDIRVTI